MEAANLVRTDLYLNRELSQLEFNRRVLNQAQDRSLPILERLRFLCICSTNLDEFFQTRVAGLKQQIEAGSLHCGPDGLSPSESLSAIAAATRKIVVDQYRSLHEEVIPTLEKEGIEILDIVHCSDEQQSWLARHFHEEIMPVLSPSTLDPARPFPRILNKSLNFIVSLSGKDAFGRRRHRAILRAPRSLPRIVEIPKRSQEPGGQTFVFLTSIIQAFIAELFPDMLIRGCYQFRVTRNSELYLNDEAADDLVRALRGGLFQSRYGDAVRLELTQDCPRELAKYLLARFELTDDDLYLTPGPVNLNRLMAVYNSVDRPELKYPSFEPGRPVDFSSANPFETISSKDILLNHPYQSFETVIDFLAQAAADPDVLAIKQTLYRTAPHSAVIRSLIAAAEAGKEVTVMIELRARFDEATNIRLATTLQEAGVTVVYGTPGYKTHCKMMLVVRRERGGLKRYAHLGTGNYHPLTAMSYTDYGLFTADERICSDVHHIFMHLTTLMKTPALELLSQAPFQLHARLLEFIERERANVSQGGSGRIIAKVNSLTDATLIQALYKASIAGVRIDLIVRGICCLRPGLSGVSENIRVRSIVGRFLEHSRCFYFYNGGEEDIYCSSADWMERNMNHRIEIMFPIQDKELKQRLIEDLELYLRDTQQARELKPNGRYCKTAPASQKHRLNAQAELSTKLSAASEARLAAH